MWINHSHPRHQPVHNTTYKLVERALVERSLGSAALAVGLVVAVDAVHVGLVLLAALSLSLIHI